MVSLLDTTALSAGQARLDVTLVERQSTVTSACATSPLKLLTPRSRGPSVWAYVSSFGGGLVAGDQTELELHVHADARCFLGTQASTKVYRNPSLRPCGHVTQATLDPGSLLVFAPDPVQAFAGSTYTQRQEFHLADGAGLVLVDWLSSGRAARGERWAFTRFRSRNEVFIAGERVLFDSLLLDPSDACLTSPHGMGRFNCLALVAVIGKSLSAETARLLEALKNQPVARRASLVASASPIREGALLRLAGESVEDVGREIVRHLRFVRDWLQDDPWMRKW